MAGVSASDAGAPRDRLLAAAIRLLEDGGPEALQARRVAAEVGASTMAVYTHFGGMRQLVEAVAREGLGRMAAKLGEVGENADPLEGIFEVAWVYRAYALENPHLFRVMYGVTAPGGQRLEGAADGHLWFPESVDALEHLSRAVRRGLETGSGKAEYAPVAAMQIWCAGHGYVLAELAGYFGTGGYGLREVAIPLLSHLVAGLGHPLGDARRAAFRVLARRGGG